MLKIDLLNHCVKDPPNICSPFESNKYDFYLNGVIRDHFTNLANGTIKSEILICGYLRRLLYEINEEKLLPIGIVNCVKQTYFPQYIALEIGASNKSFYVQNFKQDG